MTSLAPKERMKAWRKEQVKKSPQQLAKEQTEMDSWLDDLVANNPNVKVIDTNGNILKGGK